MAAIGKRSAAIKNADVIESQEPALEYIAAAAVLAIHPPGEVDEQFVKDRFEEGGLDCLTKIKPGDRHQHEQRAR